MTWRELPVQKRVLVVAFLVTACLGVYAVRAWLRGHELSATIACGLIVVSVLVGSMLLSRARRSTTAAR